LLRPLFFQPKFCKVAISYTINKARKVFSCYYGADIKDKFSFSIKTHKNDIKDP